MRAEKQLLLKEIQAQLEESNAFILFSYLGLSANTLSEFRDEAAKVGGSLEMVRKRIFQKAAADLGMVFERENLPGHIALLLGDHDPVAMTKALFEFEKNAGTGTVNVLGGRFEGQVVSAAGVKTISELPGKNELRAQFLGLLETPLSQMMCVVETLLLSVAYCLENRVKAEEGKS